MNKENKKVLLEGVFGFDRGGLLHLLSAICAAAAIVVLVINNFTPIENVWIYAVVGAGLAVLFGLIGIIGKSAIHKRKFVVYEDGVEYRAGKKKSFKFDLAEMYDVKFDGVLLTIKAAKDSKNTKDGLVKGLVNGKNAANVINDLLHPKAVNTLKDLPNRDMIYVNIAYEELRKAKELLDAGMITLDDYLVKKKRYVECCEHNYLIRPGEAARTIK